MLRVINNGESLSDFDDGKWTDRFLPIYDIAWNLLSPVHYSSLKGALVDVTASVLYHTVEGENQQAFYLQVHKMQVLKPGRDRRCL